MIKLKSCVTISDHECRWNDPSEFLADVTKQSFCKYRGMLSREFRPGPPKIFKFTVLGRVMPKAIYLTAEAVSFLNLLLRLELPGPTLGCYILATYY